MPSVVASFTDAWIETIDKNNRMQAFKSHLLQMRGLKPKSTQRNLIKRQVASFTDAWIETGLMRIELLGGTSRIFYRCVD